MLKANNIDITQAEAFLVDYYASKQVAPSAVALIGEGAWSRCFGFQLGDQALAIRFGHYVDDFLKDQRAYHFATPGLPVPEVLDIGQAFGGHYAISTRVHGVPLENVPAAEWPAVVPSIVDALEAMRTADLSATTGFGGWGSDGDANRASWSEHLLATANDLPEQRTHGWRAKLASFPQGEETFVWGYELLKQVANDSAPRCLLHCDLINRNVLVDQGHISGVFDWGCSIYGDHLYELAWFEFWAPWHPNIDVPLLRAALEQRWHEVGYVPADQASRLVACYLHIGLDHLGYNAFTGDGVNLAGTAERMRVLVGPGDFISE